MLLLVLCISTILQAQVSNEGRPKSWKFDKEPGQKPITMPSFDLKVLEEEDADDEKKGDKPWRFGKEFLVDYDLDNSGEWTTLPDGSRIWRIRFVSKGAKTLNFLFEDFYLPEGATIYLYSNDKEDLLGAYTHEENNEDRILGSWLVNGEDVWIEYYEPSEQLGNGTLKIGKVVHGYRTVTDFSLDKNLNASGNCNYDVDCPIDSTLEALKNHNKKGVVLLMTNNSGFCTGSLINNTTNNGVPYILTANHCYSNPSNWSFRFNWISPNPVCGTTASSTNGPINQVMSGATLRARRANSDFCLVEINNSIPSSWDVVWNGWNRSTVAATRTFGIHHPSGDIMKVCVDNQSPVANNSDGNVWYIQNWELGVTEGGSSGSPLFDQNGRVIGQLWAGEAACIGTSYNGGYDIYGRFDTSWNAGGTASTQLSNWLDPNNSGATILDPYPALQTYDLDASLTIDNVDNELCEATITPTLVLYNAGIQVITSVAITYQLTGQSLQTYNWTGALAQGTQENISLGSIGVTSGGSFTANITQVNNTTDQNTNNNSASHSFTLVPSYETSQILFTLQTDNYADETAWQLTNSSGTVLYSGGPYTTDNSLINLTFDLNAQDCYTFTIVDFSADGICCSYGNGYYRLQLPNGQIIKEGGDFDSSETYTFSNNTLSIDESRLLEQNIAIYPNPADDVLYISNTTGKNMEYEIYTVLGQRVGKGMLNNGVTTISINVASGTYIINCIDASTKNTISKKVIIK